ncbi:MAG: ADP-ribosylglycohydrolase family protein [Thermoguttaceae bacterium]|nr:ADP-ribosylglycohydrolase family protein [Thermoguttaceae bacterium]
MTSDNDRSFKCDLDHFAGCLLGGAIGDAFGSSIQFTSLDEIKERYGNTICFNQKEGEIFPISDETQMSIFTADGLLRAYKSSEDIPDVGTIFYSYKNWYRTQTSPEKIDDGWIMGITALYSNRHPGKTCMSALSQDYGGTLESPINDFSGTGGLMRVGPIGLLYYTKPALAFELGCRTAVITHGCPDAWLSAGVLSALIAFLIQGYTIGEAVTESIELLKEHDNHENLQTQLLLALQLGESFVEPQSAINTLDRGDPAVKTLAIAIYCALRSDCFSEGIYNSAVYCTNRDATASVTGNIIGAYAGQSVIPSEYTKRVEFSQELIAIAADLLNPAEIESRSEKYPATIENSVSSILRAHITATYQHFGIKECAMGLPDFLRGVKNNLDPIEQFLILVELSEVSTWFCFTHSVDDICNSIDILLQLANETSEEDIREACGCVINTIMRDLYGDDYLRLVPCFEKNIKDNRDVNIFIARKIQLIQEISKMRVKTKKEKVRKRNKKP